jgi:beta/gamma crystallin
MRKSRGWKMKLAVAGALSVAAVSALAGQVTLYERPAFQGQSTITTIARPNLPRAYFNDGASSIVVSDGMWEACTEANFRGRCAQLVPGNYSGLSGQLNGFVASVRQIDYQPAPARVVIAPDVTTVAINPAPAQVVVNPAPATVVVNPIPQQVVVAAPVVTAVPIPAGARVTLYQHQGHLIRAVELTSSIDSLEKRNFENSADAALVSGGVWRLCDRERGRGSCNDFAPGRYDTLGALDGRVKSAYLVVPVQERAATVVAVPPGRAVVYQYANFGGPSAVIEYGRAPDMDWTSFRNPASSLRIESGSWLVCSDIGYQGECRVLDPGDYPVMTGLGNGIGSARQVWRPQYGSMDLRNQATR